MKLKENLSEMYLNIHIGYIEPMPIQTPWGEHKGGYIQTSRDGMYEDLTSSLSDYSVDIAGNTPLKDFYPMADTSMAKARSKKYYPLSLDLSRMRYELNNVYRVAYLMEPAFNVGKLLEHPAVGTAIEARRPGAMQALIVPWFKEVMGQRYTKSGDFKALDNVVNSFRTNVKKGMFFLAPFISSETYFWGRNGINRCRCSVYLKSISRDIIKPQNTYPRYFRYESGP